MARRLMSSAVVAMLIGCSGAATSGSGGGSGASGGGDSSSGGGDSSSGGGTSSSGGGASSSGGGTSSSGGGTSGSGGGTSSSGGGTSSSGGGSSSSGGGTSSSGGGTSSSGGGAAGGGAGGGTPANLVAYVGGYGNTISAYSVNASTGILTPRGVYNAGSGSNPSFLAIDLAHSMIYSANEGTSTIGAHALNPATGALTALNTQPSAGGPAHVSIDRTGRWVLSANYGGGTTVVFPVKADGGLGAATDNKSPGMMAHQIVVSPGNDYALVPCLGSDHVSQFLFKADAGTMQANAPPNVNTANGAGPRHLAFHPNGRLVYLLNETAATLTTFDFDPSNGKLSARATIDARAVGATGNNTGAEVQVHPSGAFVYTSNRGDNNIAIFAVSADAGFVTRIGQQTQGINTPRHFSIAPGGELMLVANQGANTVTTYRVFLDGGLTATGQSTTVSGASFVEAVPIP